MYQSGYTPLLLAADNGHLPVVEYLVERGANIEAKDKVSDVLSFIYSPSCVSYQYEYTPLLLAAMIGHLPVVEYLLEKGADMEAKNNVSDVISLI